jgi:hypothetical protein
MARFLFLFLLVAVSAHAEISALYLSWYGDPTTTMTVQWHSPVAKPENSLFLQNEEGKWEPLQGESVSVEWVQVHHLFLKNLKADTEYSFRVGDDPTVYKFRTAPENLSLPLRFVIGGDIYQKPKIFRKMNETILKYDPLFAVLGGDIAYAIHTGPFHFKNTPLRRWLDFLKEWKEQMRNPDNRLIPFVIVAGNHDIAPDDYELFFKLFAFPKKQLYRTLDFSHYMSLILLDTGHFEPIENQQTLWLGQSLKSRQEVPFRFAVYHVGAYPSYYSYESVIPKKIRTHWTPLFDRYGISAAFENHSHTFKKTYPLKANQKDPNGIIYFGDGSWGVTTRKPKDMWYLEKKSNRNSVYMVELSPQSASVHAIDLNDEVLDRTKIPALN